MKIYDRLILAIYSLCLAVISFVIIIIPFDIKNLFAIENGLDIVRSMKGNYWYSIIGLIFLIVSIRFIFSGFNKRESIKTSSFLVMRNEYGEILIFEETIIALVHSIAVKFSGIRNVKTKVNLVDGQVNLTLRGEVSQEFNIPEIGMELQSKVKEHIENITGAKVGDVKIEIGNVSAPTSRVK